MWRMRFRVISKAWRDRNVDVKAHSLFMCLDGPGTGKLWLLDEFSAILNPELFGKDAI